MKKKLLSIKVIVQGVTEFTKYGSDAEAKVIRHLKENHNLNPCMTIYLEHRYKMIIK